MDKIPYWKGTDQLALSHVEKLQKNGWEIVGTVVYVAPDHRATLCRKPGGRYSLWGVETDGVIRKHGEGRADHPQGRYWWVRRLIEEGVQPE